jgi:hypothetical protein
MSTTLATSNPAAPSARLKIDGELVILGADGRLSFDALQQRLVTAPAKARGEAAQLPAACVAFDLLAIGGIDLRTQRWTARRQRLEQLATGWAPPLQLTPVTSDVDEATEWFEVLPAAMGVEGLVVTGASTRYTPGRRDAWVKVKHRETREVIVGGVLGSITRPDVVIAASKMPTVSWSSSAAQCRSSPRSRSSSAPCCPRPVPTIRGLTRSARNAGAAATRRSHSRRSNRPS